ncbi:MAG: hypothetical protein HYZ75_12450 [Elusimicrobia bacterium]|nr:hypothetical protein [Elusimicrobiota bacterium]
MGIVKILAVAFTLWLPVASVVTAAARLTSTEGAVSVEETDDKAAIPRAAMVPVQTQTPAYDLPSRHLYPEHFTGPLLPPPNPAALA